MKITVKYFASIREAIGRSSELRDTAAATLADLRDELLAVSPVHAATLARGRSVRMALNHVMSDESSALSEGCEVAFFPPVTGG
jgi:molybdopterin synthase sulfur carrier subunit